MATVFFMKFNQQQGALVADEMTWHLSFKYGYRPTRYGDAILNLIDEEQSEKNDAAAVYAGIGFPSLHEEVAEKAGKILKESDSYLKDLDKTGELVRTIYQKTMGRMLNDKLRFNLGFDRDEFNKGKCTLLDREVEIKQEDVLTEARKLLKYQDKSDAFRRIFNNEGLLMGYDKENGIRAYHIENSGRSLDFAYPFDALGTGKEIGTKIFADVSSRMNLDSRRQGFTFEEGLFLLLNCYVESCDFNNKAGGYTQVFLIDATRKEFGKITAEINDHNPHLATETIRAYRWGLISGTKARELVTKLLVKREDWKSVEEELFNASKDPELLNRYLMGYKAEKVPLLPLP